MKSTLTPSNLNRRDFLRATGLTGLAIAAPSLNVLGAYNDAAQTPNTQFTVLEYSTLPVIIENRNLSMEKDAVVMDQFRRTREGFVLQYEGGYFAGLRAGGVVFDTSGKDIQRFRGDGGAAHAPNFIKALRSRRAEDLNAPIAEGHVSSAVCHLGNLSYRLAQPGKLSACRDAMGKHSQVTEAFTRLIQSLEGIGVDLDKTPFALGPWLDTDPASGQITGVGGSDAAILAQARRLARGSHRPPYVLPA